MSKWHWSLPRFLNEARRRATRSLAHAVADEHDWIQRSSVYRAIYDAALEYGNLVDGEDLTRFERKVFSQNGEDGVILEIFRRIGVAAYSFVEFGVGTGREGNAVLLADVFRWNGLFIECDDQSCASLSRKYETNGRVNVLHSHVRADNINALLASAAVPETLDLMSIDVDGQDYWIWKAMHCQPRLVVIEFNASLPASSALVEPPNDNASFDGTGYFGASLGALCSLATTKGYQLVHTDLTGVNAFFLRKDLVESLGPIDPPSRPANYCFSGHGFPSDEIGRPFTDVAKVVTERTL